MNTLSAVRSPFDVEAILRTQGENLDLSWVAGQLVEMYGNRDPRVSQWNELVDETRAEF